MLVLTIDASKCSSKRDVYGSLLAQLGAPVWHGRNLDALWDTISSDNINAVKSPYTIRFVDVADSMREVSKLIGEIKKLIDEAKSEGLDVECHVN